MKKFASVAIVGFVAACGGGGGGSDPGVVNTQSATQTATTASSVRTAVSSSDGNTASTSVSALTSAGQSMVTPQQQGARIVLDTLARVDSYMKNGVSNAAGDCICTESGCTFDQCGTDQYMVNGTITKSGDSYTFDMSSTGNIGGVAWDYDYAGTLTISTTLIDGNFTADGDSAVSGEGINLTYSFATDMTFDNIVLDGQGCATGGSLSVTNAFSVSGVAGADAGNYNVNGSVTFGPACGQVTAN